MEGILRYLAVGLFIATLLAVKLRFDPIYRGFIRSQESARARLKHHVLTFAVSTFLWPVVIVLYTVSYAFVAGGVLHAKKKKAAP